MVFGRAQLQVSDCQLPRARRAAPVIEVGTDNLCAMTAAHQSTFDSLAAQLVDDHIAFGMANPVNDALERELHGALADLESGGLGPAGMVVLEEVGQPAGELRDLAQDLKDAAELDTVIIRTPASTSAVSDSLDRAQVEAGQAALIAEPDYAAGVRAFGDQVDAFDVPWAAVALVVLAAAAIAAAVSVVAARWTVKP